MKKLKLSLVAILLVTTANFAAAENSPLSVEELRMPEAVKAMPETAGRFGSMINRFSKLLYTVKTFDGASRLVAHEGNKLWLSAISAYHKAKDFDDRPLYWARLRFNSVIKNSPAFSKLTHEEQQKLLWVSELATRGNSDVNFDKKTQYKVLLTGFDPFFLDRHITQSNPSGVVATALDDKVLYIGGIAIEIETLIVPVRFQDFDQGMIETMLTPRLKNQALDMLITVSMGRENFDLERFPGKRRSAKAPDNLNVYTGASAENPLIPLLDGKPLAGPEFNQFSLPAEAMVQAEGAFKIIDNHQVTTTQKTYKPETLSELRDAISVQGSGGGYLSNEISYRSLLLRDKYQAKLPVGHIHTPRFNGFEPTKSEKILAQVEQMIRKAVESMEQAKQD